jgi:SAM-dependent methyltransferase
VLDAGCGHGAYLPYLVQRVAEGGRVVGLDFGAGTLAAARAVGAGATLVRGDVQALPLADDSVDLVVSAHMLYHVPEIRQAMREFRRVLRPGGALAIIIDGERDSAELGELYLAAGGAERFADITDRFHADNARDYLDGIFDEIADLVEEPELVITEARSLVAAFDSLRSAAEPALRPGLAWGEFLEAVDRLASETIEREGAFVVREEKHLLVCR